MMHPSMVAELPKSSHFDQIWIDEYQQLEPIWAMEPHHEFMRRMFWHLGYLWAWMALWGALLSWTDLGNAYAQIMAAGIVAFTYGTCGMIAWRMIRERAEQQRAVWADHEHVSDWQEQEER